MFSKLLIFRELGSSASICLLWVAAERALLPTGDPCSEVPLPVEERRAEKKNIIFTFGFFITGFRVIF